MRILVAYDGGPGSAAALEWAARRAELESADIHLLYVLDASPIADWAPIEDSWREAAESVLDDAENWLAEFAPSVRFTRELQEGDAARLLILGSSAADLVVVGSKRGDPTVDARFESVPRKVAALSHRTTVVVPATWNARTGPVIVGVGDDEVSSAPVAFAARSAELTRERLRVVHGWYAMPIASRIPVPVGVAPDGVQRAEQHRTDEVAADARERFPDVDVEAISEPGRALDLVASEAERASLTVVGRRRTGLLAEWLLGSVTHDLLLRLPSPVAVVPTLPHRAIDVAPEILDEDL